MQFFCFKIDHQIFQLNFCLILIDYFRNLGFKVLLLFLKNGLFLNLKCLILNFIK
jgi:hypothetical protein